MEGISLPTKTDIQYDKDNSNKAIVTIESFYPGYGQTVGNTLRRVLLSSLTGAAVTNIKIKGVDHEFSTIEHVKEEVLQIILNIKRLRLKMFSEEPQRLKLSVKGKKAVTAGDITANAQVEVVNPDLVIATLTDDKAEFEMELVVEKGKSYLPVEVRPHQEELGMIAVDAIFTPVIKVGYKVESSRIGQRTDYDKLILDIETDGSITVEDALVQAGKILVDHFQFIANIGGNAVEDAVVDEIADEGSFDEED